MTTIITRLYSDKKKATSVISALKEARLADRDVDVFDSSSASKDSVADMKSSGVHESAAKTYAKLVGDGNALVVVRAPVGRAIEAAEILDGFDPVDAGVEQTEVFVSALSESSMWGGAEPTATLTSGNQFMMSNEGFPPLSDNELPLSTALGLEALSTANPRAKLLTDNPTPFSSAIGQSLLLDREPKVELMNDNPTPLSSAFGISLSWERSNGTSAPAPKAAAAPKKAKAAEAAPKKAKPAADTGDTAKS